MEIRLPVLRTRATVEPSTLNREERTVEITWTTGARVLRGFWDRYWEELSLDPKHVQMDRLNNSAPFLVDHRRSVKDTVGVVVPGSAKLGVKPRAKVRFLKEGVDRDADVAFEKMADGIVTDVSVGYVIHKMEKVEDGDDKIPVMRATRWEPLEISLVPIGADPGAGVRSETAETYPCEIIVRGEAPQEEQNVADKINTAPTEGTRTEAPPVDLDAVRAEAAKAERERVAEIGAIVRKAGLGSELAEQLVRDGKTIDETRAAVLDELAKRSDAAGGPGPGPSGAVEVGAGPREKFLRGAEAWLVMRAGKTEMIQAAAKAGKVKPVEADPGEFRGLSLVGLAREALERAGVSTRRMSDARIAELALAQRAPGLATASDFPVLLENVTYKILLGAYETVPYEWSRFCKRGSVANFHAHNRYRPGAFGTLDAVNDHGELKNKAIPDGEKRSVTIGTYGNTIGISRRTLIQDDMGVFTDLAGAFGMAAGNTVESAVWATVKANSGLGSNYDANPLFHSSRNNINTTGSALSVAGLDADRVIMKRQAAPSGTTVLNLVPAILVLPTELGMLAKTLNSDAYDPDGTNPKFQKSNGARGMFRDIVDSAQITGTRRYLFADPAIAPVIEVTFLEGQEAPQMESQEGFEVLGLQWRVFLDFGVNLVDYRGAVTNAGQ